MQTVPGLDVVRAVSAPVRAKSDDGSPSMEVRFSAFGNWYEIESMFEGRFLERTEAGSFAKTIKESRDQVKVLFNHGFDPQIGDKVLGSIADLREDRDAAVGDVDLFDTTYVRDLLPGLKAGVYGSSMRFRVVKDEWSDDPGRSDHNPDGIPERTIKEVRLFEFGPVTFPANPESTASVRSLTDAYYERLRSRDPQRVADVEARARLIRTPETRGAADGTPPADGAARSTPDEPPAGHSGGLTPAQRRERIFLTQKG